MFLLFFAAESLLNKKIKLKSFLVQDINLCLDICFGVVIFLVLIECFWLLEWVFAVRDVVQNHQGCCRRCLEVFRVVTRCGSLSWEPSVCSTKL